MNRKMIGAISIGMMIGLAALAREGLEMDTLKTTGGDLEIAFVGHSSLIFTYNGKRFYVDPWTQLTDYAKQPKADVILITHEHPDHLDPAAIKLLARSDTLLIVNRSAGSLVPGSQPMTNGETRTVLGVKIEAVPAYNLVHRRASGVPFHPKGVGNGYVLTFGDTRIYVAGDTENIPEMKRLTGLDVAFLPMNRPYTMTPEMVADAARAMKPKILYPYHYGESDPAELIALLKDAGIEIRVRNLR